jgi:glycosyltransferase involved in cell wall biosynthesis
MKQKLHILSVVDDLFFGGGEYRLLAFGQTLDRTRFDYTLVTLLRPDEQLERKYGSLRGQFVESGIEVIHFDGSPVGYWNSSRGLSRIPRSAVSFLRRLLKLRALIRERQIDVLDIHLPPTNPVGVLAGLITSRPTIVTLYQIMGVERWLLWLSCQFNLCMANLLVTDSAQQREAIRQWVVRSRKVRVIPNPTLLSESSFTAAQMRISLELPVDPRIKVIGQISRLIPYKGHMVLLDAARLVLAQEADVAFLIVGYLTGDSSYPRQLNEKSRALGIEARVRFVSYPGNIADVWRAIDIHAHASLLDSLPNAILESMCLGKPAVVTNVGGISTMVENEKTGLVIPAGDPQSLADALLRLLRDPSFANRLGEAARHRYVEKFRPENMTSQLEQLFLEVEARSALSNSGQREARGYQA